MLRRLQAGETVWAARDQITTPTYNVDLAAAVVELIERDLAGVMHIAGPVLLDRYAFALEVCAVFDLDPARVLPVDTAALNQRARRPLRAGLAIDRARLVLRTPLRGPREGLEDMREVLAAAGRAPAPRRD
jgi:dTDP-4-dehydrorhamnose reductase